MRRDRRHPLRRSLVVAAVLVAALALRVGYVEATSYRAVNDAGTYNRFAATIAQHGDYRTGDGPGTGAGGSRGPTAYFPPAYPYLLAVADLAGGHSAGGRSALEGERLAGAALGTVSVALLGLVALEAFGAGPALAAIVLAAVYPPFVALSGSLVAENLMVALELAAVWCALRARRARPRRVWAWVAGCGVLCGLATLAHENAALLLIALGVAVAGAAGRGMTAGGMSAPSRRRAGAGAVALLAATTAAAVAPWTIRNAVELHHFVPVSTETGITLRGADNADSAAARPIRFKWRFFWQIGADQDLRRGAGSLTEVALSDALQRRAQHWIGDHPGAVASIGWHNLTRLFELENTAAWRASARAIDLHLGVARAGVIGFWVVAALALAGLLTRPVRAGPRWLWAIPVLLALSVVFVNVETPRFREPIDPFLLLAAGCAVSAGLGRLPVRRSPR